MRFSQCKDRVTEQDVNIVLADRSIRGHCHHKLARNLQVPISKPKEGTGRFDVCFQLPHVVDLNKCGTLTRYLRAQTRQGVVENIMSFQSTRTFLDTDDEDPHFSSLQTETPSLPLRSCVVIATGLQKCS